MKLKCNIGNIDGNLLLVTGLAVIVGITVIFAIFLMVKELTHPSPPPVIPPNCKFRKQITHPLVGLMAFAVTNPAFTSVALTPMETSKLICKDQDGKWHCVVAHKRRLE